jgi:hypothetical protein
MSKRKTKATAPAKVEPDKENKAVATPEPPSSLSTDVGNQPAKGETGESHPRHVAATSDTTPVTSTPPVTHADEVKQPEVIHDESLAPGTGIDLDGDGNADQVVGPHDETEQEVKPEPFSYEGKVRLSQQHYDAVDKDLAIELTKASHVNQHYKNILLNQIEGDQITPEYANMLRRIIDADHRGSKYSGTLEG